MIHRIIGGIFGLYRVVPVNEAHIRIMMNSKGTFCSRTGYKSSYWYIPFITKLHKLPLCNLAIPVNDIKLNDMNMAKFVTDIMCFINIKDVDLAVERLILTDTSEELGFDFVKLSEDLRAIMESVGRTVVTKQSILEIYMNRAMLDQAITKEVETVFPKWGIELVDLELKDVKDAPGSTIIHDIERKVAAEINRDAEIKVATTNREAEVVKAQEEETYRKRQIEKDETIAAREQDKNRKVAEQQKIATEAELEVTKVQQVKNAEIQKAKMIVQANQAKEVEEINKEQKLLAGQGDRLAAEERAKGEAAPIREKGYAEADAKEKLQDALNKFEDKAIRALVAEKIVAMQQAVGIETAKALTNADLRIFSGGDGDTKSSFDLGKIVAATMASNEGMGNAVLNRLSTPNDLGIRNISIGTTEKPIEDKKVQKK